MERQVQSNAPAGGHQLGYAIAFVQQQGGTGKTTILAHLAHSWAHHDKNVGLIDLDQRQSLTEWARLHREIHLNLKAAKTWSAKSDIHTCNAHHDITLVDCPSFPEPMLRSTVNECDLVIAPVQPTGMDLWSLSTTLKICEAADTPCRVVLNRVPTDESKIAKTLAALEKKGAQVLTSRLDNRVAYSSGFLDGYTALSRNEPTTAHDETENLRIEIDQLLDNL